MRRRMRQGFRKKPEKGKKWENMSDDEKIDALLKDMGMEPLKLSDPSDEELEEFFRMSMSE